MLTSKTVQSGTISPWGRRSSLERTKSLEGMGYRGPFSKFVMNFSTGVTKILESIWDNHHIPEDLCELVTRPIYNERANPPVRNTWIHLISVTYEILVCITLWRLISMPGNNTHENWADLRSDRDDINHTFMQPLSKHRLTFHNRRSLPSAFLSWDSTQPYAKFWGAAS